MANEQPIRYYKPKADFKFDIADIQNFVYDMSRCIKCKGCYWVDHTYMPGVRFMTRCPSAAKYEFDAYGAYGKMRIGHAIAEGKLAWTNKPWKSSTPAPSAAPATSAASGTWTWRSS